MLIETHPTCLKSPINFISQVCFRLTLCPSDVVNIVKDLVTSEAAKDITLVTSKSFAKTSGTRAGEGLANRLTKREKFTNQT